MILYIVLIILVIIVLSLLVFINYRDKKYIGYLQSSNENKEKLLNAYRELTDTMMETIANDSIMINELKQFIEIQNQYIQTGDIEQDSLDLLIYWIER